MINIVCAFDNGYSQHCAALLASLFDNNKGVAFRIFALSDYVSEGNKHGLYELASKYKCTIDFLCIDKTLFESLPHGGKYPNISIATYYRLLIPEIIPTNIDKVLYLDCDIIINGKINGLWETDISEYAVAGVEDSIKTSIEAPERLKYPDSFSYFNAGVLLMNLCFLRKMNFTKMAMTYFEQHIDRIVYHDQDVLNALLYDKKLLLPIRWNVMECFLFRRPLVKAEYEKQLSVIKNSPIVIHYTGTHKPWFKECNHPYRQLYFKYLALTEWAGSVPTSQYSSKMQTIFYKLKIPVKYILDYLHCGSFLYAKIK